MNEVVFEILGKLEKNGYQAYLVGGCVRDLLLEIEPADYDIATNATPDEIQTVFSDEMLFLYGKKYGTIVLYKHEHTYEITTLRKDGKYFDGRRPETVIFSQNLTDDLLRRDFTINAMAADRRGKLFDPLNGREDLQNKILRTVGDADRRLQEDGLRVLRAIRFVGRYSLRLDEDLFHALCTNSHMVKKVPLRKIYDEVCRILLQEKPSVALYLMEKTGVLDIVFPELRATVDFDQKTPYHTRTLFDHLLCVVDHTARILDLRFAALFHDIAKVDTLTIGEDGRGHFYGHELLGAEIADKVLKRFRVPAYVRDTTALLIREHMKVHEEMTDKALRRQIRRVGQCNILKLYNLMIADCVCTTDDRDATFLEKRQKRVEELLWEPIFTEENFFAITGHDLIDIGYVQGKKLGDTLRRLQEEVLDDPSKNTKTYLLKRAEEWLK